MDSTTVRFVYSILLAIRINAVTGDSDDDTLVDAKWESIALAPVGDPAFPHDYFLFTAVSYNYSMHVMIMTGS